MSRAEKIKAAQHCMSPNCMSAAREPKLECLLLAEANVAYLNLSSPSSEEIVCKLPRDGGCMGCPVQSLRNGPGLQEECASNPDPASCTVDLEDRRFWRGCRALHRSLHPPMHRPFGHYEMVCGMSERVVGGCWGCLSRSSHNFLYSALCLLQPMAQGIF